ncbi:MAG: EAL domain-containing protein, partial [bacterium]
NVSYSQFEVDSFVDTVNDILAETGFPAENLCLELTERLEVIDIEHLIEKIKVLKSEGIKVALDDFGTGFSSLNLLTNLPVDLIKIDREFIKDITENIANQSVIKAVTQCANELGIKVCLEGIENRLLIDFLRQYNADSYQGYYYSKPIEMESFLQKYAADISSS